MADSGVSNLLDSPYKAEPMIYGDLPEDLGLIDLSPVEMMFWLYCPIKTPESLTTLPPNLRQFRPILDAVMRRDPDRYADEYVYLTAKTLWVTPGNPGNRPGWHSDGFGSDDVNYIWYDGSATEFIEDRFTLPHDCADAMEQMAERADKLPVVTFPDKHLLRLTPSCVHRVPADFPPGLRTFVKVSISPDRYNLAGASINMTQYEPNLQYADASSCLRAAHFKADSPWITVRTPRGNTVCTKALAAMPKIPDEYLKCCFYLYPSVEDAEAGRNYGGTGFLVSVPSEVHGQHFAYAVTNWHVAVAGGHSVIRVNLKGGGYQIFDYGPDQWSFIPNGHDIAMIPFELNINTQDVRIIPLEMFATEEVVAQRGIGPGEDVVMIGRFIDAEGVEQNQPAVRFGNISLMPVPLKHESGATTLSYCIDMHSRTGFSGSPIMVYRQASSPIGGGAFEIGSDFVYLLGIHWGQFPEQWEITPAKRRGSATTKDVALSGDVALDGDARYVKGMSGMTCVAPASGIVELLSHPKIAANIKERNAAVSRQFFSQPINYEGFKITPGGFQAGAFSKPFPADPGKNG